MHRTRSSALAKKKSKPLSKAQRVVKGREHQQRIRDLRKRNSRAYKSHLERDRERKKKAVADGKIKRRCQMNEREIRIERRKVRERVQKYRMKKRQSQQEAEENKENEPPITL